MVSFIRRPIWVCLLVLVAGCGGGGSGGTVTPPPSPPPVGNRSPIITSATAVSVPENTADDFFQVSASDPDGDALRYSLSGTDAALFAISAAGKIRFLAAPDFEKPADANHDNVYDLQVNVSDGALEAQKPLAVTVTNVLDLTAITQVGGLYGTAVQVTEVPGQKRVFVAQEDGQIFLVDPSTQDTGSLYLTVPNSHSGTGTGMISIVAAPDYATSGFLYVMDLDDRTLRVIRYGRLNATQADPASAVTLLSMAVPRANLGGWIGFGPNNLLYVAIGDGDVRANRTDLSTRVAKVLRIDPSRDDFPGDATRNYGIPADNPFVGGGGAPEVYVYSIVHPHGGSFDGDNLYLGDGQEGTPTPAKINLIRPQDAGRGYNAGIGQGPIIYVNAFLIGGSSASVGGFVYKGPSPQLAGQYIFFALGRTAAGIFSFPAAQLVQGTQREAAEGTKLADSPPGTVTSFGIDSDRNLYMTSLGAPSKLYVFRYN
ncbi:MAG: PQQ-dependent sugar dehydrogenase [Allosphingosinicella sp.]